ncbi:MAG: hypothetical protein KDA58_05195 [Planctomycetaceae bacterium]|nr:hypothetical protein [Planctomycetaceae bacterium]
MNDSRSTRELQEEFFVTDQARLRRWLPWLLMFSSFRIALHYRRMAVALLFVWSTVGLGMLLQRTTGAARTPLHADRVIRTDVVPFTEFVHEPWASLTQAGQGTAVLLPMKLAFEKTRLLLSSSGRHWPLLLEWFGLFVLMIMAGSLLTRMVALQVTRHEECSFGAAWGYFWRHVTAYFGGLLTVILGLLVFATGNAVFGVICRIPAVGPYILAVGWLLALVVGLLMAIMLVGLAVCWPLMICTTSVEGTDPFDGLSRSYNYLFVRPWYALFLLLVLLLYGAVLHYFVTGMANLVWQVTLWTVGQGIELRSAQLSQLFVWKHLLGSIPAAFAVSYFWTSMTIGYLLLRKSEDATPLDVVDREAATGEELPLVGIPAAQRREQTSGESK